MILSVSNLLKARTPIIWLQTDEYTSAIIDTVAELNELMPNHGYEFVRWDVADGMINLDHKGLPILKDGVRDPKERVPAYPLQQVKEHVIRRQNDKQSMNGKVYFLLDFHEFVEKVELYRQLQNLYDPMSLNNISIVIVSPRVKIPSEIADYVMVVNYGYPNADWLKVEAERTADDLNAELVDLDAIVKIGQGLTRTEFCQALFISVANSKDRKIHVEYVAAAKEARIAKESVIKILPSDEGFESLIGLTRLKNFAKGMILSGQGRGVLLLGVPGSGKSAFAATLGYETDRTTLYLDFATLMGGIVGETESKTERALRLVDAMQPCILVIDEIEKGLAGTSGHNGDSGTSRRQGSLFLKWLSDHKTDVFVVATANSIVDLPPEFKRAERWDATFFVDIPHKKQAQAILDYYAKKFELKEEQISDVIIDGLTGAEIKTLCRLASSLDCSLTESKQYVRPITESMDVEALRRMAVVCAIPADDEYVQEILPIEASSKQTRDI